MKKTVAVIAMAVMMSGVSFASTFHKKNSINARQQHQQQRIAQGIASGQITPAEAQRLERREAGIERREDRMRASGGKFTRGERLAIQKQLNGTSRAIRHQRHDRQRVR